MCVLGFCFVLVWKSAEISGPSVEWSSPRAGLFSDRRPPSVSSRFLFTEAFHRLFPRSAIPSTNERPRPPSFPSLCLRVAGSFRSLLFSPTGQSSFVEVTFPFSSVLSLPRPPSLAAHAPSYFLLLFCRASLCLSFGLDLVPPTEHPSNQPFFRPHH